MTRGVPSPTLKYRYWASDKSPDPSGVVAEVDSRPPPRGLANVHDASISLDRGGALGVWLTGAMRKADGTAGQSRCLRVDIEQPQPDWLEAVIADARQRLS